MKKVLFVATVRSHIGQFHISYLKELKKNGYEIHAAYRDNAKDKPGLDLSVVDKVYELPFERSPLKASNYAAYQQLKKIIENQHFDIIHCHTPVGGVAARLAARKARKRGTKVIYTAHGFHFYKGASVKNWLLFYPVERFLAGYTDALITINREDFAAAEKFKAGHKYLINGVGIDLTQFAETDASKKRSLRAEYGFDENDFIIIYPADLSVRKNQKMLLRAVAEVKRQKKGIHLTVLMPGQPIMKEELEDLAKAFGIQENCRFMGYRRDMSKLIGLSDLMVSSSRQEGLPVCIMEAMAVGKPVIATRVRGNEDLVEEGYNGYLCALEDEKAMAEAMIRLYEDRELLAVMGENSRKKIAEYGRECVNEKLYRVYEEMLGETGRADNK